MENLILIGCGQHANVVLYNVEAQGKYRVIGYLESDKNKVGLEINGLKVLDSYLDNDLELLKDRYRTNKFFVGFGNMKYRKFVFEKFINSGWDAANIIHPATVISPKAVIGKGVLIECGCLVTPNPIIGNNVVINTGSQINHDNVIENHVYIASGVILSGGVTIRENALLDDGVIICLGKQVGQNCIIGAGAVVTKDMPNNVVAYGNPAKIIRDNHFD